MVRQPTAKILAAQEAGELPKTGLRLTASQVEWKWKVIAPEDRPGMPTPKQKKSIVGLEVGVGADTSHLNKRKQRARVEKVSREVQKLKAYNRFSGERDALIGRLEKDSELTVELVDRMKRSGNRRGLQGVLEQEKLVKQNRPPRGTSIASSDSNEYVKLQVDKIRELVAYKTRSNNRDSEVSTN